MESRPAQGSLSNGWHRAHNHMKPSPRARNGKEGVPLEDKTATGTAAGTHMNVLLSARALTTATHVITGIGQYISLGFELSRCCAWSSKQARREKGKHRGGETPSSFFVALTLDHATGGMVGQAIALSSAMSQNT